jgi:hypothetical protein
MIDLEAVAHGLMRDFPGGARAVAAMIGMRDTILADKCRPSDKGHHLMVNESLSIQIATGDHRILFAEAEELGYMLTKLPDIECGDIGVAAIRTVKEFGDFVGSIESALRDGAVTPNELRAIERELFEALAHITRLHQLVAAKAGAR